MSDALFSQVKLLLFCDGTNGSTTFTDSSWGNRTVTAYGNAQITTTTPKFGTGAALFDGTSDRLSVPTSTDFDVGSGDFTMELWLKAASSGNAAVLAARRAGAAAYGRHVLYVETDNTLRFVHSLNDAGWSVNINTGTNVRDDTYKHIAVNKSGGVYTVYVDGVSVGTQTTTASCAASTEPFSIGGYDDGNLTLNGRIDSFRFTVGTGRYPSAFTAPTAEFELGATASMTAALVAPLALMAAFGGATAALTAPSPVLAAFGGATATLTVPMQQMASSFGGGASLTAPMQQVRAVGHDATGENAANLTAPMQQVAAAFGGTAKLTAPMQQLQAAMTGTNMLRAELTAPMQSVQATGQGSAWLMSAQLQAPSPVVVAYGGGYANLTAPMPQVSAHFIAGSVLSAALTAPMQQVTAVMAPMVTMSANLVAPMQRPVALMRFTATAPMQQMTATAYEVITATFEGYSINLKPSGDSPVNEVTHYTNFPFSQIIRFGDDYYGVAADGLYLLEGSTDHGTPFTPIKWTLKTGTTDFGSASEKTIESAYFGGVMGPADTVTLYAGNKDSQAYKYTTPRGNDIQNHRQKFGRGIKSRYFALGVSGTGPLELDNVEFNLITLTRRI